MPQLFSRMDDLNWLTPTIADILQQGAAPPGGDGSIREQMLVLQNKLSEMETPARVVNVRPTPSYTLFIAKPDTIGRLGNRRQVTINEIKRSLGQIAEETREWKIGFVPQTNEVEDSFGLLLRTNDHQPLSLRRLLVRNTYRDLKSTMSLALGSTLEQRIAVRDLAELGGILVCGTDNSKYHLINSMMMTLLMLNTPGELRTAVLGSNSGNYRAFINTPHTLGRPLADPEEAQRLLNGLARELKRRQDWLSENDVNGIDQLNDVLREQGRTTLPRIVLLIDALDNEDWRNSASQWSPILIDILHDGGKAGIHLIIGTDARESPIPTGLINQMPVQVIMRAEGQDLTDKLENFHGSLVRFIDAFLVQNQAITPIEVCAVTKEEIQRIVLYWRRMSQKRSQESEATGSPISGRTGVTALLQRPDNLQTGQLNTIPDIEPKRLDEAPMDFKTQAVTTMEPQTKDQNQVLRQAEALAAYLGWIGPGPLQDILLISRKEAQTVIDNLKKRGIVEDGETHTPRFIQFVETFDK